MTMERIEESSFSENDDSSSYIEIEVDPLEYDKMSNQSEEYELRISISSTLPLPSPSSNSSLLIPNNSATFTDSPLTHSSRHQEKKGSRTKFRTSILQCYEKKRSSCKRDEEAIRKSTHWDLDNNNKRSHASSSSMVDIDLGAHNHKRTSKWKSCSKSCDTSPIRQPSFCLSSSDNSIIQPAIAYCKTSFGQTSDFSFCN
ncbi:hypothetical protein G2W53_016547 [Senna tora]|uniref:Uncharacterized protein n=1 Tax=Senna tora TaxID=362788 RepID=A0A834TN84_9FABA|nr:hypothetical protein G2W53_016547 [Senna tora]